MFMLMLSSCDVSSVDEITIANGNVYYGIDAEIAYELFGELHMNDSIHFEKPIFIKR